MLGGKLKSRRGRLVVERLEDRCVPSITTVTSLGDSGFGVTTYGQSVTLAAIVRDNLGNAVAEGTVSFYSNGVFLASTSVNSSGQAFYTTVAIAAGAVFATATYNDPFFLYASSTSNTDTLTVNPAPLTITPVAQSMVYGATPPALTLYSANGFVNGDTTSSLTTQPTLNSAGANPGAAVGTYPNYASGAYDPNYTITYNAGTFTVTPDSTATVIGTFTTTGTAASAFSFGQTVKISAGVGSNNSSSSTETGSVGFYDGTTLLGTAALGNGGVVGDAIFTTSTLSSGTHTLTAVYAGDANHTGSTSSSVTITVGGGGTVSGTDFRDYNCNGIQDPGEPGIAGLIIFVDLDNSGILKSGDPMATTDANGHYQITGVPYGTYTIRQVTFGGVLLSTPAGINPTQTTVSATQSSVISNGSDVYTSIAVPLTLPPNTPFQAQGSSNADYVEALYRAILDRDADPSGLANWTSLLNSGSATRLQVVKGIRNSVEHFTQEVTDFYQTLLGRAPDSAGLQSWVQQLEAGMREEQIAFYFLDSPEYLSQGDKHFVDAMYISLLGRNFDSAGEATWLNQLAARTLTHEQVITDFLYSTESLQRLTEGYYECFLQRQADPAGLNGWVANLSTGTPFLTTGQLFLASDEFYNRAAAQG